MPNATDDATRPRCESDDHPILQGPDSDLPYVVGIGASADGLGALERFLEALPADPGMAFLIPQYLAPAHDSDLVELLLDATSMPVERADDVAVEPNRVYILPPGKQLALRSGRLDLEDLPPLHGNRTTIDFLFRSLADQ